MHTRSSAVCSFVALALPSVQSRVPNDFWSPLAERSVIVTGAATGLGRSHAVLCARLGARVVVNDIGVTIDGMQDSGASAAATVAEIEDAGGTAVASTGSIATEAGAASIVAAALDAFGRVDAVVNNAGIARNASIESMSADDFRAVLDVDVVGAFNVSRAAYATMKQQLYGRLVFTSSGSGLFGRTDGANYAAAKAAMVGLSNAFALEGADAGIFSNVLLPGARTRRRAATVGESTQQATGLTTVLEGRMEPEFVSPMVAYLASEACAVTKEIFSAVGGCYSRAFIGVSAGWLDPVAAPAGPADIDEHLAEIRDLASYKVPYTVFDEITSVANRLGAPKSAP